MICLCSKCHQLYEGLEVEAARARLCPRCTSVAELLAACDELHAQVRRELVDGKRCRFVEPAVLHRAQSAVAKARAL